MLESIHFLLTYTCNLECDHCFLCCGPRAPGTFGIEQICTVLDQALQLGTVKGVYFEGGEPMLFYPLLLESIRQARQRGFTVGIVTNAFWATSIEEAMARLRPLHELGVERITMSDDSLHYGSDEGQHKQRVEAAAAQLGMTAGTICTQRPAIQPAHDGQPASVTGGVMFRGRAVHNLGPGLPRRPWQTLSRCPHEKLDSPTRVHVDCYGNVHLCQGLSMGNLFQTPLPELLANYNSALHPIAGPLLRGGPAELARAHFVPHDDQYVDECHLCYETRRALLPKFPGFLAPPQVYGLPTDNAPSDRKV